MGNINMAVISGRVGADPETRFFDNGAKKATMNVATTRKWLDKQGQQQEATQWHRVECWQGLVSLIDGRVKRGSLVTVVGEIIYEKYQDKDGVERTATIIKAQSIDFVSVGQPQQEQHQGGGGAPATSSTNQQRPQNPPPSTYASDDDDLPF